MESSVGERSLADDYESLLSTTDAEMLKRAWKNEKASPEILKFEATLIHRSRQQIQLMLMNPLHFTYVLGRDWKILTKVVLILLLCLFIKWTWIGLCSCSDLIFEPAFKRLKNMYFTFKRLRNFGINFLGRNRSLPADLKHHLKESVLTKLPNQYQSHLKQSSASEEDDMVPKPKLDTYVVCRSKKFLGAVLLDDSGEEPLTLKPMICMLCLINLLNRL
ncbi:DNA replication complex GINS protein SLD5-like isoform X2 [Primulina eburnea]|uniref:DNA replication complex GINS protein SLD5-like isoform X2 n=1 Tax=Primulina eburnea TaxID=1245227 RepID=UPI003C6CB66F